MLRFFNSKIAFSFLYFTPFIISAQILITEVSYNPKGLDDFREWIEITNVGISAIDLSEYKLKIPEKGAFPPIRIGESDGVLQVNEIALLAERPSSIREEFPLFTGDIFNSNFEPLTNGERLTIEIYNSEEVKVASATFEGTGGTGKDDLTVHFDSSGTPTHGVPSPGSLEVRTRSNTQSQTQSDQDTQTQPTQDTQTQPTQNTQTQSNQNTQTQSVQQRSSVSQRRTLETSTIAVEPSTEYITDIPLKFTSKYFDAEGEEIRTLVTFWNFGDANRRKDDGEIEYAYKNPGTFLVTARATYRNREHTLRQLLTIHKPNITLEYSDGVLKLQNNHNFEINLSGWKIQSDIELFVIPEGTFLISNGELVIDHTFASSEEYRLLSLYDKPISVYNTKPPVIPTVPPVPIVPVETVQVETIEDEVVEESTEITKVEEENDTEEKKTDETSEKEKSLTFWVFPLLLLVIIGIASLYIGRRNKK